MKSQPTLPSLWLITLDQEPYQAFISEKQARVFLKDLRINWGYKGHWEIHEYKPLS